MSPVHCQRAKATLVDGVREILEAIGQFAKDIILQVQQNLAVTNTNDEGRVPLVEKEHSAVAPNDSAQANPWVTTTGIAAEATKSIHNPVS